jgi:hypothetical protein
MLFATAAATLAWPRRFPDGEVLMRRSAVGRFGILAMAWLLAGAPCGFSQLVRSGRRIPDPKKNAASGLLVEFRGKLRRIDKKTLELDVTGEQSLTFFVNKKTTYLRGKQALRSGEALIGQMVVIEARPEFEKDLIAVNVLGEPAANSSVPAPGSRP